VVACITIMSRKLYWWTGVDEQAIAHLCVSYMFYNLVLGLCVILVFVFDQLAARTIVTKHSIIRDSIFAPST